MAKQTQSLAASAGALTVPDKVKMPAVFGQPGGDVKGRSIAAYVTFAHPKRADEWNKLMAKFKSIAEHDMFFVADDRIDRLEPMKCTLLTCKQYWATTQPNGDLIHVSWEERPKPYREFVQAVLIVYLNDSARIANVKFKTTKCSTAKELSDALKLAGDDAEWAAKGPEYKETLICKQPFMRFFAETTVQAPRPSKTSGLPYRPMSTVVKPTGPAEWRMLQALCEGEDVQKFLDRAAERFQFQMDELKKKAT